MRLHSNKHYCKLGMHSYFFLSQTNNLLPIALLLFFLPWKLDGTFIANSSILRRLFRLHQWHLNAALVAAGLCGVGEDFTNDPHSRQQIIIRPVSTVHPCCNVDLFSPLSPPPRLSSVVWWFFFKCLKQCWMLAGDWQAFPVWHHPFYSLRGYKLTEHTGRFFQAHWN